MEYTREQLCLLSGSEFNAILAADPEIRCLNGLKYDKALDSRVLLEVMGMTGMYRIGKLPCLPLTAAKWAFLWMLGSPFVCGGETGSAELDLMLYVLCQKDLREIPCGIHELPAEASGFSNATGLCSEDISAEIRELIRTAFQPLEMLPVSGSGDSEKGQYDAVWVTFIAGVAARESGMSFEYCLHRMSLSAVCAFFVNWRKREGMEAKEIRRRTSEEVQQRISDRVDKLAEEFLKTRDEMAGWKECSTRNRTPDGG